MIQNGKDTSLARASGGLPQMGDALGGWKQKITFGVVTKTTLNGITSETMVEVQFMGVMQPFTDRQLLIKPEGERSWSWYWLHADPSLNLPDDNVVLYRDKQYRVMKKKNYTEYGYIEYQLVTDYEGVGPTVVTP